MKEIIFCPRCKEKGYKPVMLAKYEDVVGRGDLYLWCKRCKREIHLKVDEISLDK